MVLVPLGLIRFHLIDRKIVKVHQTFLGAEKILIENVANLDSMPRCGAFVMAFPMKVKNGTEAPVRLVGLIEREGK